MVFRRAHSTKGTLRLVQGAGEPAVLLKAANAVTGIGELVERTLAKTTLAIGEKPDVFERAETLHRLQPKNIRIRLHRFCQERLEVP